MKRVKITLPKGGTKAFTNDRDDFPPVMVCAHTVVYEAEEIIIEGDGTHAPAITGNFCIPFDLEAAKAGAKVLQNGQEIRWLGLSDQNPTTNARNIIENEFGLAYVTDDELSMAPNPRRTVWVNLYKNQSSCYYESPEEARERALDFAIARAVPIVI